MLILNLHKKQNLGKKINYFDFFLPRLKYIIYNKNIQRCAAALGYIWYFWWDLQKTNFISHKQNGLRICIILKIQMYDSSLQHIVKIMQIFTFFCTKVENHIKKEFF